MTTHTSAVGQTVQNPFPPLTISDIIWTVTRSLPDTSAPKTRITGRKPFYTPNHLTRHVQIVHQKEKAFICEHCGMSFSCRDNLYVHKSQKHRNPSEILKKIKKKIVEVQEFICDHCGKIFYSNAGLVKHQQLKHEVQELGEFNCDLCESKYDREIYLKVHLWKKHNVSKDGYKLRSKVTWKDTQCKVTGCRTIYTDKPLKKIYNIFNE